LNKVYFVLDEFATVGHLSVIEDAITTYRKFGVAIILFVQSIAQLHRCFPNGQHVTAMANVSQTYWALNDLDTAKYVSERLGEYTIVVSSGGTSTSRSMSSGRDESNGASWSINSGWQLMGRRLVRPEELMSLPPRCAVSFIPGVPAIASTLKPYWEAEQSVGFFGRVKMFLMAIALLTMSVMVVNVLMRTALGE
jgi:type IV secretion system protein VirD4